SEPDAPAEGAPDTWDLARVRRRLERGLVQAGLLARRARWLCLLADATVAFREPERKHDGARCLVVSSAEIVERCELSTVSDLMGLPARFPRARRERQLSFDAAAYDRLRTLSTELSRVHGEGGDVAVRIGLHRLAGECLAKVLRLV